MKSLGVTRLEGVVEETCANRAWSPWLSWPLEHALSPLCGCHRHLCYCHASGVHRCVCLCLMLFFAVIYPCSKICLAAVIGFLADAWHHWSLHRRMLYRRFLADLISDACFVVGIKLVSSLANALPLMSFVSSVAEALPLKLLETLLVSSGWILCRYVISVGSHCVEVSFFSIARFSLSRF